MVSILYVTFSISIFFSVTSRFFSTSSVFVRLISPACVALWVVAAQPVTAIRFVTEFPATVA